MISSIRHISEFDPNAFNAKVKGIDVIGCGATGSRVGMSLAKLGISTVRLWDFDTVESHNIANQMFSKEDIGNNKAQALAEMIKNHTGTSPVVKTVGCNGDEGLFPVVFLLVDSMEARLKIWETGIKYNVNVQLMIETRMGIDKGRTYAINPTDTKHIEEWEKTTKVKPKKTTAPGTCNGKTSIAATADVLTGYALWQLMTWFANSEKLDNEIIYEIRPLFLTSKKFEVV